MARSRSRSSSASRSAPAAPRRAAPAPSVPAKTHAAPPAPVYGQQQARPGMMAQMAATAGSVAVGSAVGHTLGHGISSMLGLSGGGSREAAPAEPAPAAPMGDYADSSMNAGASCEPDSRAFMRCMDANNNDVGACQFYLDMLKQCQSQSASTMRY